MEKLIQRMESREMYPILKIQTCALKALTDFLYKKKILQLMPVMLSPVTDPLCHSVYDASIQYLGQELKLTKSMLLHKQLAVIPYEISRIFIVSPNIRLEAEDCRHSGRHLIEFSQLDIEFRDCTKEEFMRFTEQMIVYAIKKVKKECGKELKMLKRKLKIPITPFKAYESKEFKTPISEAEAKLSAAEKEPFWILDHEREFYDREDKKRGYYHNYDLVWPEGFGEALSGGEREFEHKEIERKMKERKMDTKPYETYLDLAKRGILKPTAGGGLGVERFVRYLCGKKDIADVTLFPRKPGEKVIF
ncbi:MAG: asparagine synthetase A [Candidatus Woesearchaeota archaeon]